MSETTQLKKSTVWKLLTVLLGILLIISLITGGFGITKKTSDTRIQPNIGTPKKY